MVGCARVVGTDVKRYYLILAVLLCAAAAWSDGVSASQVRFTTAQQAVDAALSRFGTYTAVADTTEGNSVRVLDENWELLWRHRQPLYFGGTLKHSPVLQFAPDESFLVFPAFRTENDIALVNPRTGEPIAVLTGHSDTVDVLVLSPDGSRMVSAANQEIFLWKRQGSSFVISDKVAGFSGTVSTLAFTPDGTQLALGVYDDMKRYIDLYRVDHRLTRLSRYETPENNLGHEYSQLAFSPDGRWLAAGYSDSLLVFEHAGTAITPARRVDGIELGPVISVAFSPDGALLFTGHIRDVRAWRVSDGSWAEAGTFSPHLWHVKAMRFSEDGTRLAIAGGADTNALGLFSVKGTGPSGLGTLLGLLSGRVSTAQRRFLGEPLARQILGALAPADTAPRDMFETESEYAARRARVQSQAAGLLQEETERRFGAERQPARGAVYAVAVPLQSQGSYAIDTRTYTLRFMDTDASVKLERDAARELYQNWQKARVFATRVKTADAMTYDDFRISLPLSAQQFPLGLSENPFTGEELDRYGARVPSMTIGPDLLVRGLSIDGVFPALYHYYAEHALGTMTLQNTGSGPITELSVQLFVPGLMKAPTDAPAAPAMGVGQGQAVEIRALFDASVLDRSDGGSASAELTIQYASAGRTWKETIRRPIGLLNRNAIRWSDDRKVGAFMTVSNPAFLRFSGQVVGAAEDAVTAALTRSLLSAGRMFAALKASGIRYVVDPSSAYESLSRDHTAVDYVRFPMETLDARSGDCDDLSVLYASLLESVGVDTAFITTPGHIFTAFDLGMTPEAAAKVFGRTDDLVVRGGTAWVPVETTMIEDGFVKAWQTGAAEWRDAQSKGSAAFFTSHDAWQQYLPAGFAGAPAAVPPSPERVAALFGAEMDAFRAAVLGPRETELLGQLSRSSSPAQENTLGVLYAQFGLLAKALERFDKAADYLPALVNAASVCSLRREPDRAQGYLKRAQALSPDNPRVLIALAFSYLQAGNEPDARKTWERTSRIDPALAARFPLTGSGSGGPAAGQARAGRADPAAALFGADWMP